MLSFANLSFTLSLSRESATTGRKKKIKMQPVTGYRFSVFGLGQTANWHLQPHLRPTDDAAPCRCLRVRVSMDALDTSFTLHDSVSYLSHSKQIELCKCVYACVCVCVCVCVGDWIPFQYFMLLWCKILNRLKSSVQMPKSISFVYQPN